ncbi:universal stress protein [Crocinitomicaceae bacterium]|nr:universal stress protein [Crocinitomicaceae bacterium]
MLKEPIYLVPVDFTEEASSAVRLALDLAQANNGTAYLLHVVGKSSEKVAARKQFADFLESYTKEELDLMTSKVIEGDIFNDIGKAGDILKAALIVMGTHGAHGMQKVFGSRAVKLISSSATPFLITQGKKEVDRIKNIVMPFSFAKESIQITNFVGAIAKKFNATIHLCGFHDKDDWLDAKTKSNQLVVKRALDDMNASYEIAHLPPSKTYNQDLVDFAKSIDADMFAAAYFKEGILPTPNNFIQGMIENELNLPLLTVNAEELSVINSNYSFMTV